MIKIVPAFSLDQSQHEMVVSCTIALAAVGAGFSGPANRILGRKGVLMAACITFTIGAVLMATADSYVALLVGRMVVGLGVGIASSTVPLYIAELAPQARRGQLVAANNAAIVIGQVVASVVDGIFSEVTEGWRFMLGLGGLPSVVMLAGEVRRACSSIQFATRKLCFLEPFLFRPNTQPPTVHLSLYTSYPDPIPPDGTRCDPVQVSSSFPSPLDGLLRKAASMRRAQSCINFDRSSPTLMVLSKPNWCLQ